MPNPVLVGVDASETAYQAAEVARDLALALDTPLVVISAFDSDHHEVIRSGNDEFVVSATSDAEKVARSIAEKLRTTDLEVTYMVARGKPADILINEAARLNARLIVVGNRRMRGIGRVLGSVAASVAHNALCDVYIANTYDDQT